MRKRIIGCICILLLLASCSPREKAEDIIQNPDDESEQEVSIIPGHQLGSENYKVMLPYHPSAARGVIVNQVANRLDIDEMEEGLRRHSIPVFDPENYYFEEGQYLSRDTVYNWLGRSLTKKQLDAAVKEEVERLKKEERTVNEERIRNEFQLGLNPPLADQKGKKKDEQIKAHRENPRYISHILEQNFLTRNEDQTAELSGVSIVIALKSVYKFQVDIDGKIHGPYYEEISEKEMLTQGKEAAQIVLERLRDMEELNDIPIMITLYQEEKQEHPVPGNFIAKTVVPAQDMMIDEWETIDEKNVLFPSQEASKDYSDDEGLFDTFADEIATFFPNYVGVIGEGFYIEDDLQKMSMLIPMEFQGSGEITGFTQYLYGLAKDIYENTDYALEIKIESNNEVESIIYREPGSEDINVHILH
ncbi:MAG TPA: CamS family sex pheromone protein [Bacillota bacterium]|nr:CamS family sex pheromone protein [Bacillota bacterium]